MIKGKTKGKKGSDLDRSSVKRLAEAAGSQKNDKETINIMNKLQVYQKNQALLNEELMGARAEIEANLEKSMHDVQLAQSQKMDSLRTFAGGIAHDFNNILAAILGYAELGVLEISKPDNVLKDLAGVIKASVRARDLVKQISYFSRQEEKKYEPLRLSLTIKESLKMLRSIIPPNIEIQEDLTSSGMVMADPTQINQMIINICFNAIKAMSDAGGVLKVNLEEINDGDVSAACGVDLPHGSYLRLIISDTGHGMTSETMERMYEPYFTMEEVGKGRGLGLAVVHGIIEKHRGCIHCESTIGKGTIFSIYLPRVDDVEVVKPLIEMTLPKGTERVLFIDDEPDLAEISGRLLESLGYKVTSITSSKKALELFRDHPDQFDLVITDMIMSGITGDKLAQSILAIRPDMPVILCTGYNEYTSEEAAKIIGIREVVMKPFVMEELARSIRKALDIN